MEKSTTTTKEKLQAAGLLDLVFSWSLRDVLNRDLYKGKVKQIPDTFSSTANYLNSFKDPLIEETRAEYCAGLESVAEAPACEISTVRISKGYKPPKSFYYEILTREIRDIKNLGGHHELLPGDLVALTNVKPRGIEDLIKPDKSFHFAFVATLENAPWVRILSSEEISPELRSKEHGRIFATYLMNITTNMRIWRALNPDPRKTNAGLLQKVLQYHPANSQVDNDEDCSVCNSKENFNAHISNVLDLIGSFGLDESQKNAVLSSISMRKCSHKNNNVKLIWGPPGTGKTKTVSSLLLVLLKMKCTTLTCAPTNIAVVQVAKRLVRLFLERNPPAYDTYGLGDIVIFGNEERMKINEHDELVDVFLKNRVDILCECVSPLKGWKHNLESMISLLEDPEGQYCAYLNREKRVGKEDSDKRNDKKEGNAAKGKNKTNWKEFSDQTLKENKKKNTKKGKRKDQARPWHSEEDGKGSDSLNKSEEIMTFEEFVRKTFDPLVRRLVFCVKNFCTHLPTSTMPLGVAKKMIRLINLLKNFEDARKQVCRFSEIMMMKREEILCILKALHGRFPGPNFKGNIWDFCLSNACIIFCTASSSIKVKTHAEMLVIDEAAQLKECESAIPLQVFGLRNTILIGDDRQLPAMVQSKVLENGNFGRSLFQRLATLGKKKHLLNIQYRMHPSISLFPNKTFYENRIVDAPSVKKRSYARSFLEGDMYGSYSFINVSGGMENFEKGHSPRNVEEAAVVVQIIAKLFKGFCIAKQKLSIGVISPYKGQVALIEEKLGKKYVNHKESGFSVSVRSVDGFQGGEEDVIIISTVRCNANGSVGFLSSRQRTNVALTRARYCLWIVGNGTTLANSKSVWRDLVIDAKIRRCFYNAEEDMDLKQNTSTALAKTRQAAGELELSGSLELGGRRWKVFVSDDYKISISSIKAKNLRKKVKKMLKKIADGWRRSSSEKAVNVAIYGIAAELLEQYKVDEQLYLAWTVEIQKEESNFTQVIKVWDILPAYKIPILAKDLNILFSKYTVDYMNRCKYKSFKGNLVVPMSWPLHSVFDDIPAVECLSASLAAISLRHYDEGESSSSLQKNYEA